MTQSNSADSRSTLPGLEFDSSGSDAPSSLLRQAVRSTLEALHAEGLLEPRHAGLAQLALVLADAVEAGTNSRRASAAAMAAAQLLATLQALPAPGTSDTGDAFRQLMDEIRQNA